MSALLDAVRQTARRRHLSRNTERTDLHGDDRYVRYRGRFVHTRDLAEPDVEAYLNPLANDRDVAKSTQTRRSPRRWVGRPPSRRGLRPSRR